MLLKLLKSLIRKKCKPKKRLYVEDMLYPKQVYPIYCQVQSTFKFCLKNHLLKREDILCFKKMINDCIKKPYCYKDIKFNNDAHEIYKKLKSHDISAKEMQNLLDFINQFAVDIPEPTQTIKHLKVLK